MAHRIERLEAGDQHLTKVELQVRRRELKPEAKRAPMHETAADPVKPGKVPLHPFPVGIQEFNELTVVCQNVGQPIEAKLEEWGFLQLVPNGLSGRRITDHTNEILPGRTGIWLRIGRNFLRPAADAREDASRQIGDQPPDIAAREDISSAIPD